MNFNIITESSTKLDNINLNRSFIHVKEFQYVHCTHKLRAEICNSNAMKFLFYLNKRIEIRSFKQRNQNRVHNARKFTELKINLDFYFFFESKVPFDRLFKAVLALYTTCKMETFSQVLKVGSIDIFRLFLRNLVFIFGKLVD